MAASTALMQPSAAAGPTSSSTTSTNSVNTKQILSSVMSNGTSENTSDSDSGNASDHDHSPLVVVDEQQTESSSSTVSKSVKRKLEQTCDDNDNVDDNDNDNDDGDGGGDDDDDDDEDDDDDDEDDDDNGQKIRHKQKNSSDEYHHTSKMVTDSSTEEETIDDDVMQTIAPSDSSRQKTACVSNNCSLSSLAKLEMSAKQHNSVGSNSSANKSDDHSSNIHQKPKRPTGKLERITERLAKKQNGAMIMIGDQSGDNKLNPSLTQNDHSLNTMDEIKIESQSLNENDDEIMMDEDDEEIKNGFRALGLMGNVAFLGDESFKCPVCGLKLDSQHTFTLHIRSHNPNDHSNTCSLCGKTLSSASSLDRHMLIHSGERPFKCSLCGMAFTTNGNMHRHMRTHGHGSIGYTPRGQKRRAKLLTQALEKAVAAAAAGEQVDFEAINKLKKSILESKVTPPPPSTNTSSNKRYSKQHREQSGVQGNSFSEQLLSTLAPNVSIEAAAAAAVAAAHNVSNNKPSLLSSNSNNTHHGRKHTTKDGTKSNCSPSSPCTTSLSNSSTSHCAAPAPATISKSNIPNTDPNLNLPLNLVNNPLLAACWPSQSITTKHLMPTPSIQPEKGRPGRKKKQRLLSSLAAFGNGTSTSNTISGTSNVVFNSPSSSASPANTIPSGSYGSVKDRCPICAHPIRNTPDLHLHMMAYHLQERLFCNDCGMILNNYDTYTHHHCTASAATVMTALSQNPNLHSDLLFCSSNTSRMNFSSARTYAANLEILRGLSGAGQAAAAHLLTAAQLANNLNYNSNNNRKENQSLIDLSQSKQPVQSNKYSTPSSGAGHKNSHPTINCSQCSRKFLSSKELKQHHDTYCHQCSLECDSVSTYQLHQFSHSFEKLSPQLNADKMQLLKNAAAFSLLPSMATNNNLISPTLTGSLHPKEPVVPAPSAPPLSSAQSGTPSSINSLTSMANMKPDLADIESILSIVHGTTAKDGKHSAGNQLRSPISPNRASDAGDFAGVHRGQVNGGEATNQPDSPASADSAAGAVASSSLATSLNSEGQHSTKTDLNNTENNKSVLCLKQNDDEKRAIKEKQERNLQNSTSTLLVHEEERSLFQNESTDTMTEPNGTGDNSAISASSPDGKPDSEMESKDSKPVGQSNRFRCESCRLSFKSMNALRRHNRGHTAGGGHSHACHLCPYKSLDKSTLIRHLRTHNGERPFQCSICKYAFTTKANCERHVRKRHRNLKSKLEIRSAMQYNRDMAATAAATRLVSEKIFIERDQLPTSQDTVCKKCEIDFGSNRELRAHLRVPNNACSQQLKPFVCMICNIGFNTRNNCVRHIIKQHPSTIEVSEEDAAKAVAATVETESLMIETGSSSSLSPASNGQISNHSSFSTLSTTSSEHFSECESSGTYDEAENESNPLQHNVASGPATNSSFAALCQVAHQQVNGSGPSPLNLSKKSEQDPPIPVEEDVDDDEAEAEADVEMDREITETEAETTAIILDLSVKTK